MKKNRIIIAGSRCCPEESEELFKKVSYYFTKVDLSKVEIVSGTCRGADKFGEWFAYRMGFPVKQFPADWDTHGKKAGRLRNEEMAKYSTHLIAIWDGKSRGTKSMIDLAKKYNLKVRIIYI